MDPMDLMLFCLASVFMGVTLAIYLIFRLLIRASSDEASMPGHGCMLSVFWLVPLNECPCRFENIWFNRFSYHKLCYSQDRHNQLSQISAKYRPILHSFPL